MPTVEEPLKDVQPSAAPVNGSAVKSKLRYPLRSAMKSKDEKQPAPEFSSSTASKRGRPASTLSKSVGVLDLSGKDKSAKPPRRLSIPAKSTVNPAKKLVGNITPISEARLKRSTPGQEKSETPRSDVSRSATRRKFSAISSASYWLSQIKLSESASKHSISLGFFKLALQAGVEPLQRMRDELKSYVGRYNSSELGEAVKELFESYDISENPEQLQVSETCSHVPEEGTRSSDDEVRSSSSPPGTRKLRPKSLNTDVAEVPTVSESAKHTISKNNSAPKTRAALNRNSTNSRPVIDAAAGGRKVQKKDQKPTKPAPNKDKDKIMKQRKKSAAAEAPISPSPAAETAQENKENVDAPLTEEVSVMEAA